MTVRTNPPDRDARHHIHRIKGMLEEVARHAREDVNKVDDPQLKALFETTAEVLVGLSRACEHAEQMSEPAWTRGR